MRNRQRIYIVCPQYRKTVIGSYACDEFGQLRLRADGQLDLRLCRCGQLGGRCMEYLCALHRMNRRGPGTWYPADILLAGPAQKKPTDKQPAGRNLW